MYYFVYHIDTIALYRQEKPTPLMYCESTIVECVGANKNNNGRSFQFTNVSFIDLFLTDRRSLSGK